MEDLCQAGEFAQLRSMHPKSEHYFVACDSGFLAVMEPVVQDASGNSRGYGTGQDRGRSPVLMNAKGCNDDSEHNAAANNPRYVEISRLFVALKETDELCSAQPDL